MYIPEHFKITDQDMIYDLIDAYSFGIIVSIRDGIPVATHLPLLLDREKRCLTGHFALANEQWKGIEGQEVLVIFQGPHHYISSSWYETNLSVPTWNYAAVHIYGTIHRIENHVEVIRSLHEMTAKYEDPESGYRIDSSNEEFIQRLSKGIAAFTVKINRTEGKWKLSQNHSRERRVRVIQQLEKLQTDDARKIAALMRECT